MAGYQNLYKKKFFRKDIFSNNQISFKKINKNNFLNEIIKNTNLNKKVYVERLVRKNINSDIYKIKSLNKIYILKIEKINNKKIRIDILELLKNFSINKSLVLPILLKNNKNFIIYKKNLVTVYPFVKGKTYVGTKQQLGIAIDKIINLYLKLFDLKNKLSSSEIKYFLTHEDKLVYFLKKKKISVTDYIKNKNKSEFYKFDDIIVNEWNRLKNKKIYTGHKQFVHNDLHPHNLIFEKNKFRGFIDISSIKYMPIGYSLSYSLFKLFRQYICNNRKKNINYSLINFYINKINLKLKTNFNVNLFFDLALTEIIRRILIILAKNIYSQDNKLNNILPLLLNNLIECKIIFIKNFTNKI